MSRPTLVTGAAGFAGSHLLDLLAAAEARRGRPGIGPAAPALAPCDRRPLGGRRPARPDGGARGDSRPCGRRVSITAPAPRTSARRGTRPPATLADQRARHASSDRSAARRRRRMRESSSRARRSSMRRRPSRWTKHHPLVPASPYGLSKLAQELVGYGKRGRPAGVHLRGRSTISGRARTRRSSRRDSRERIADDRGRAFARGDCRSAISSPSRPDRCPRYRARLSADPRARDVRTPVQRLHGPGRRHSRRCST